MQVKKAHYEFSKYVGERRWRSYYTQLAETLGMEKVENVAVIGVGDKIVPVLLEHIDPDTSVTTIDIAEDLNPDICCDILKLTDNCPRKFDAVICCQVLEHLPFEVFQKALQEINGVCKDDGRVILSLPDGGITVEFGYEIKLKLRHFFFFRFSICRFLHRDFQFDGEHYWEINSARQYSAKKVRRVIGSVFRIASEKHVDFNMYHRFYILNKS